MLELTKKKILFCTQLDYQLKYYYWLKSSVSDLARCGVKTKRASQTMVTI